MMTFLVMLIAIVVLSVTYVATRAVVRHYHSPPPTAAPTPKLSKASKELVREYNLLPEDSRPFPDIVSMLMGLDAKYTLDAARRDDHFEYVSDFWASSCRIDRVCQFEEYHRLHDAIESVREALDAKARAVLESQHSGDVQMLAELEQRLRDEANLNHQFVRQFKELS